MNEALDLTDAIIAQTRELCGLVAQAKAEAQLERIRLAMDTLQPSHYNARASVYDNVVAVLRLVGK